MPPLPHQHLKVRKSLYLRPADLERIQRLRDALGLDGSSAVVREALERLDLQLSSRPAPESDSRPNPMSHSRPDSAP